MGADAEPTPDLLVARELVRRGVLSAAQMAKAVSLQAQLAREGRLVTLTEVLVEAGMASWSQVAIPVRPAASPASTTEVRVETLARPGAVVGPYRIVDRIAAGGMGEVYRAHDTVLNREVAIKFLKRKEARRSETLARFLREGRATSKLRHPNLLTPLSVGQEGELLYLAFPLVEGERIDDHVERTGPDLETRVRYVRDVASCLAYIHGEGLVHRDVKPSNILVEEGGRVRLIDFGLVKARELDEEGLTLSGAVLGTPRYMSPEQIRGETREVGPASDLFSLGAVAYEIWTGRYAFDAATREELAARIERAEPEPPSSIVEGFPPALERFLERAMAKGQGDRFESAGRMVEALDAILAGGPEAPAPPRRTRRHARTRPRIPAAFLAIGATALAFVAFLAWIASAGTGPEPRPEDRPAPVDRLPAEAGPVVEDPARQFLLTVRTEPPGAVLSIQRLDPEFLTRRGEPVDLGRAPLEGIRCDLENTGGRRFLLLAARDGRRVSIPVELRSDGDRLESFERTIDLGALRPEEVLVPDAPEGPIAIDRDETRVSEYLDLAARWDLRVPIVPTGAIDRPVHGLSWFEAWIRAVVTGRRLPTSDEWRHAMLGPWGSPYPHGRGLDALAYVRSDYLTTFHIPPAERDAFPFGIVSQARIRAPGSRTEDIGPYGARDMAFNVQEWTASGAGATRCYNGFDYFGTSLQMDEPRVDEPVDHPAWQPAYGVGVRTCRSLLPAGAPLRSLARGAGPLGERIEALVRYAASDDPAVDVELAGLLSDPEAEIRARALWLVAGRDAERGLEAVARRGLADPDARVRFLALRVLRVAGRYGDAARPAVQLLGDPDPAVRDEATRLVAGVEPTAGILEAIEGRLGLAPAFDTRAARALAPWAGRPEVAALLARGGDREPFRTELAIAACLEASDGRTAPALPAGSEADRIARAISADRPDAPGVVGRYYYGEDLDQPLLSRVDPEPQHFWDQDPVPGIPPDGIGVRWFGFLEVTEAGRYTFLVHADDTARLSIDRRRILDAWGRAFRTMHESESIYLDPGSHPILVETIDHGGSATFRLFWSRNGGQRAPIPPGSFRHARSAEVGLRVR